MVFYLKMLHKNKHQTTVHMFHIFVACIKLNPFSLPFGKQKIKTRTSEIFNET